MAGRSAGGSNTVVGKVLSLTATATAHGGQGATTAGHAVAKTITTGTSGTFTASSNTSLAAGALVTAGSAVATGTVDGKQSAKAKVVIGQAALPEEINGQAVAIETGAPSSASTTTVLTANPAIKTAFGASPVFFAIEQLGGKYAKSGGSGAQTVTDTVNLTVDLTKLASEQDLVVGFYGAAGAGTGFSSLKFTLTADGSATPLLTKTFSTLATAEAFFTNNAMNFGALTGSTLTLQAQFVLTTTSLNTDFYANLIVGDPPATTASRFAQHMAGLGGGSGGSSSSSVFVPPMSQQMLAAGRLQIA